VEAALHADVRWGWTPLECLPIYLLCTLAVNVERARDAAAVMGAL